MPELLHLQIMGDHSQESRETWRLLIEAVIDAMKSRLLLTDGHGVFCRAEFDEISRFYISACLLDKITTPDYLTIVGHCVRRVCNPVVHNFAEVITETEVRVWARDRRISGLVVFASWAKWTGWRQPYKTGSVFFTTDNTAAVAVALEF